MLETPSIRLQPIPRHLDGISTSFCSTSTEPWFGILSRPADSHVDRTVGDRLFDSIRQWPLLNERNKLLFAGKVHQGLNPANRRALLTLLQPFAAKKCPFSNLPTSSAGRPPGRGRWGEGVTTDEMADYTWLCPEIEAEIKFTEWTAGGLLRHAEFVTLREL